MLRDILRTSTLASHRPNKDKEATNTQDLREDEGPSGERTIRSIIDDSWGDPQISPL